MSDEASLPHTTTAHTLPRHKPTVSTDHVGTVDDLEQGLGDRRRRCLCLLFMLYDAGRRSRRCRRCNAFCNDLDLSGTG